MEPSVIVAGVVIAVMPETLKIDCAEAVVQWKLQTSIQFIPSTVVWTYTSTLVADDATYVNRPWIVIA
jgi:hypothetical protein